MAWLELRAYRADVIDEMNEALRMIEENADIIGNYIPRFSQTWATHYLPSMPGI